PAGPLREPVYRLNHVDFIVVQGDDESDAVHMRLTPVAVINLLTGESLMVNDAAKCAWRGVAGIANPQRFFDTLSAAGISLTEKHVFPDHYAFSPGDFAFDDGVPLVMTAKDAAKCTNFAKPGWWYLRVEPMFDKDIAAMLDARLVEIRNMGHGQ